MQWFGIDPCDSCRTRSKLDAIETAVSDLAHALYCGPAGRKGIYLLALECNEYPALIFDGMARFLSGYNYKNMKPRQAFEALAVHVITTIWDREHSSYL
jgi:uncharacterized protein YqjF (DUF2071 family)